MSEKTVADKMFLKNAKSIAVLNGAAHPGMVAQLPAQLIDNGSGPADVVLMFALNQKELDQYLPRPRSGWATKVRCGSPI